MRTRPLDLTDDQLTDCLFLGWGLSAERLEYVSVGGGSHHWLADNADGQRHWVTVDGVANHGFLGALPADAFSGLRCALDTALALREMGLEFVVAPLCSKRGQTMEALGARCAVAVYPYLVGTSGKFGAPRSADERAQVVDVLVRLHQATPAVTALARPWQVSPASRRALEDALDNLEQPWVGGPFSEPARATVAGHAPALRRLLATFDQLAAEVAAAGAEQVITHGEPHPANLLSAGGSLMLIDWDTAGLAPPERDLSLILGEAGEGADRYREATGRAYDPAVLNLYRTRWYLDDLASAVRLFRQPHNSTADTERWFGGLAPRLAQLPEWLGLLG